MSSQRGNTQRTRPQKYRNTKAFKNNLHDTSKEVKQLSDVPLDLLCPRCVEIIQWRVKFKKYHQLTNPKACVKCNEKTVKQAYHIVCKPCSSALKICCKCGKPNESINFECGNLSRSIPDVLLQYCNQLLILCVCINFVII
ncbi:unnamed protein product [Heterobilharzia americana]|nr:unnamed protein product [Heterobilharzia americana]